MLMQQMQHIRKPPHMQWIQWKHTKCCHHAREYTNANLNAKDMLVLHIWTSLLVSLYNVQCGVCSPSFGCICLTFLQCVFSILQHAGLMVICSSTVWLCGAHLVSASQALWSDLSPNFLPSFRLVVNVVILCILQCLCWLHLVGNGCNGCILWWMCWMQSRRDGSRKCPEMTKCACASCAYLIATHKYTNTQTINSNDGEGQE